MTIEKNAILERLSRIKDIVDHKPVKLSHGGISEYYVDIKRSYGESGILWGYTIYIISLLGHELSNFSCIVSSGYGGVPLATMISSRLLGMWNIKLSMFRDNPKEHGKPSMFDGYPLEKLNKKRKILIVDDVFTTGGSIRKIIEALPEDLTVGKIFVICNRSGIEKPEVNGIEVEYLFTAEELMEAMK
jgi:orotate phosphoribosyltransferase